MLKTPQATVFSLPVGRGHVLYRPLALHGDLNTGHLDFRGIRLHLECPGSVPVPRDADLASLAALSSPSAPPVSGLEVLDTHCGAGAYTMALLLAGAARVTAVDEAPECLTATEANVRANGLPVRLLETAPSLDAVRGRSSPENGGFDLIVHHPPVGAPGRGLPFGLLPGLLAPGGTLLATVSSLDEPGSVLAAAEDSGLHGRVLERCVLDVPSPETNGLRSPAPGSGVGDRSPAFRPGDRCHVDTMVFRFGFTAGD